MVPLAALCCLLVCRRAQLDRLLYKSFLQASMDDGAVHTLVHSARAGSLRQLKALEGMREGLLLHADLHQATEDSPVRGHAVLVGHLIHQLKSKVQKSHRPVELHQDRKCHVGRANPRCHHVSEQSDARCKVADLNASFEQGVVHDLITLQSTGFQLLRQADGLGKIPQAAEALDQCRESDQIRLMLLQHRAEELRGHFHIVAAHSHVDHGVEGHRAAAHPLSSHLVESAQGSFQVSGLGPALDQRGVHHRVLVPALGLQHIEDLQGAVQFAALHAGVQHAPVGDLVDFQVAGLHLLPDLIHFVVVPSLPVCLDDSAEGDRGRLHLVILHLRQRAVQPRHVPQPHTSVQQGVEHNLVRIVRLLVHEPGGELDATLDAAAVGGVLDGLHQDRHRVLIRSVLLVQHFRHEVPGLGHTPAPHSTVEQSIVGRRRGCHSSPKHLLPDFVGFVEPAVAAYRS
mmetsp:Transcript_38181/g.91754  ORF Transcript_38181/g.91754 Transcript_38181/m.91754 type:complete len:457 (+) Transcript_38181:784-2154(+)